MFVGKGVGKAIAIGTSPRGDEDGGEAAAAAAAAALDGDTPGPKFIATLVLPTSIKLFAVIIREGATLAS